MISVQRLTKRFGEHCAVDGVSFEIKAGETFALLGPNGSGKTTTLKCIVGLMRPTSGKILINGVDSTRNPTEARGLLSYLPQRVAFHENLTAREVLDFYRRLRKLPAGRVEAVLDRASFNLNGSADRLVSQFSGGMIQRLAIAVATLADSPILILDEPTISLDPEGTIGFRQFISSLKQAGKTTVFSSHVLSDVELLADRVALLVGGKLVALETVDALRQELMVSSRIRLELLNPDECFLRVAREAGATEAMLADRCLVISSKPEDRLGILRAVEDAGAHIERFSTEEPSLEEIYLRYVNEQSADSRCRNGGGLPNRRASAG